MKMTLLQIVQNILNAMDDDEVNSISDTVQSQQIAEVVRETFHELMTDLHVPEQEGLVRLDGIADTDYPNKLGIPSNVSNIKWVRYWDYNDDSYKELSYVEPEDFLKMVLQNTSEVAGTTALVMDGVGPDYYIPADRCPKYFTTLDDTSLVFDAFDSINESTMQASKCSAWARFVPAFELDDDFTPAIDDNLFPYFLAEAKSACFLYFKQVGSTKDEQRARRQKVRWQWNRHKTIKDHSTKHDYSRRRR